MRRDQTGIIAIENCKISSIGFRSRYIRISGRLLGSVDDSEQVSGIASRHLYSAEFEILQPEEYDQRRILIVEVENRGRGFVPRLLDNLPLMTCSAPSSEDATSFGNDSCFFFDGSRCYARIQWQVGLAEGVPHYAQGIGLVILRDFGRFCGGWLARGILDEIGARPFSRRILVGISQSAWFINAFITEGFNKNPVEGGPVFAAAITKNGAGNWLAINSLGTGEPQRPYLLANGWPLRAHQILKRPECDPFLVDIAEYTDYYRIRASISARTNFPSSMRRYDWPSAHSPAFLSSEAAVFQEQGCNEGFRIPRNVIDPRPFLRTILVGLESEISHESEFHRVTGAKLPPSKLFELGNAPVASMHFNDLPGADLKVPVVDPDDQPIGGVRFPEVDLPLGRLIPPALSPCTTSGIFATCGNVGGFMPFTASEIRGRYGSPFSYLEGVQKAVLALSAEGYLMKDECDRVIDGARTRYLSAVDTH